MTQGERRQYLIQRLLAERGERGELPANEAEQRLLLRGLMNVRPPRAIDQQFIRVQDEYLTEEIKAKGIVHLSDLKPVAENIYLWQGDITLLEVDAIVNAANGGMTGCYVPNHKCIDNCIHTFSGLQLRLECGRIMEQQGHEEPVGRAKITQAYNLPAKYVIHTVGPMVQGALTQRDCDKLVSCYRACLELARQYSLESIAFCCISTGVFRFPNDRAAELAVHTVRDFLRETGSGMKVIFNVFKDTDLKLYEKLLANPS